MFPAFQEQVAAPHPAIANPYSTPVPTAQADPVIECNSASQFPAEPIIDLASQDITKDYPMMAYVDKGARSNPLHSEATSEGGDT